MPEIGNKIVNADIDLIDESFDASQSKCYHLSIQIEPDRVSFCVLNTLDHQYIVLRSYHLFFINPLHITDPSLLIDAYRAIFDDDDLLKYAYKNSSLLWISPRFTFVPEHLFDPNAANLYLTFNHGTVTGEHTFHRYIRPANLYHVFSCPEELKSLVRKHQPFVTFFNQSAPLIETALTKITPAGKLDVTVFYYFGWMDIAITKDNQLLFYNSFKINSSADSVYYLAGVCNLFDIDLLSTKIIYPGNLQQMPPEIAILKDFVERIVECELHHMVKYSHYIREPLRKIFTNLFNLYRCE